MQIGPEQGAFMALIVKLMGARRVIEFGTFTGYSSLAMALAGATRITCADVSREYTDIARRYWARAGVENRMELHLDGGKALAFFRHRGVDPLLHRILGLGLDDTGVVDGILGHFRGRHL